MKLHTFLSDLFETGKVVISSEIEDISQEDAEKTLRVLQKAYAKDGWEMPSKQPDFDPKSAFWAAKFVYHALHLTILRHIDTATVEKLLTDFEGETTPETMYSVDVSFRHLPELLSLAKGLAPSDSLVDLLKKRLNRWCFSAVGVELVNENETFHSDIIFLHPALRTAYIDRIIEKKDLKRALREPECAWVKTALGDYANVMWLAFDRAVSH
jgi:hypothetical protein